MTARSDSGYGGGWNTSVLPTLNTALASPMPKAIVPTPTVANARSWRRPRAASRRSYPSTNRCWRGASIRTPSHAPRMTANRLNGPFSSRRRSTKTRSISFPYSSRRCAGYRCSSARKTRRTRRWDRLRATKLSPLCADQAGGSRVGEQPGETLCLGLRHAATERRQAVVAPPLVVMGGVGPLFELLDEAGLEQALDHRVQRAGTQSNK